MKRFLLALCLIPSPALAGDWWQGVWSLDAAWCAAAGQIGQTSPAPIRITETAIEGYENACEIKGVADMPEVGAVKLDLTCTGEGMTDDDARLIMRGDGGIWMWFGFGAPDFLSACP